MSEVVLEMKNVTKRFPGVIALKEVSIAVEKGEVMAICGENGARKVHADEGSLRQLFT